MVQPVPDLVAAEERGIEDRRRRLANAAADRRHEHAVLDRLPLLEAALGGARPDHGVEREGRAGLDDGAVEQLREQRHVEDAIGGGVAEARRLLVDDRRRAERARLSRRQLGLRDPEGERRDPRGARVGAGQAQVACGGSAVEVDAAERGEHARAVADELPARVLGGPQVLRERRSQGLATPSAGRTARRSHACTSWQSAAVRACARASARLPARGA